MTTISERNPFDYLELEVEVSKMKYISETQVAEIMRLNGIMRGLERRIQTLTEYNARLQFSLDCAYRAVAEAEAPDDAGEEVDDIV